VDYPTLSRINPRLIYASITGFGQNGPYRDRAGHDLSFQSVAGLLDEQSREPGRKPAISLGNVSGALFAVIGILSALNGRLETGRGTYIDVSMTDCLLSAIAPWVSPILNGRPRIDVTDMSPANALFKTSDGRVLSLSIVHEDHFWRALCLHLDLAEHAELDFDGRAAKFGELSLTLAERIATDTLENWGREFDRLRIAWSPVNALEDLPSDPHFASRGMFAEIVGADGSPLRVVGQPLKFSAYRNAPMRPVPPLGEANEEYLSELLSRSNPPSPMGSVVVGEREDVPPLDAEGRAEKDSSESMTASRSARTRHGGQRWI
jgi:crotonobetainyl-CoA:carnitine CoA-transferase CaiB-like acyl-CoA transferase